MLDADQTYRDADPKDLEVVCNGCGAANAKFDFVPDTIWFLSINQACQIHDWDYHVGKDIEYKGVADRRFLNNMLRLIEASNKYMKPLRRRRALKYYEAVNLLGGPAYWVGKNK